MKEDPCKSCTERFERISCGICNIPKAYKRYLWLQSLNVGDAVVYECGATFNHWKVNRYELTKITNITDMYIILSNYMRVPKDTGCNRFENSANDEAIFPYTDEEFHENPFDENSPLVSMKYIIEFHELMRDISMAKIRLCNVEQLKQIKEILEDKPAKYEIINDEDRHVAFVEEGNFIGLNLGVYKIKRVE